ncbi:MAG TPA: AMP-dependent synthetase/ligase [Acidimicrobiales bacterium]|nr:AMP-dependent synthetase/ligase [Acidimicrobiales bacterium]
MAADVPPTLIDYFERNVRTNGAAIAMRFRVGTQWHDISWADYGRAVEEIAAGLIALGVAVDDSVGVLSGNRPEWHEADLAIMRAAGRTVPIYPTNTASQTAYVLRHSGARVCFVDGAGQAAKVLLERDTLPAVERLVTMGDDGGLDDPFVMPLEDLRELGRGLLAETPSAVAERGGDITSETVATIVYTSGTTGPPKGTLITHGNITATIAGITLAIHIGPEDRFLSFLPLSHIAERVVSHFGQVVSGGQTWFAQSLATVPDDLRACRPTIFFAVPRVWQKLRAAILADVERSAAPIRSAAERYLALAVEHGPRSASHERMFRVLDRVIGSSIRRQLGLDRAAVLISGAAPIAPEILSWLHGIGLPVGEVYGQTEDCGPTTLTVPGHGRIGTVGRPLPGLEVRVADDGEILARGPSVCVGYLNDPERTAELVDDDGWMHSGDVGAFDADGYLTITGRKKDLIVTSSGKNVAPQNLETALCASPLISQAVVVGDNRAYLTALIALDSDEVAALRAMEGDDAVEAALRAAVDRVNRVHAPIEQIKTWRVLPHDLALEDGEITPTLKVKRDVVAANYRALIEEMYATEAA